MLTLQERNNILIKYLKGFNDTGSSEIQVILLTFRINKISFHLKNNIKDNHNKLGLLKLVNKRRKNLNYLKKKKYNFYINLINDLNLKK